MHASLKPPTLTPSDAPADRIDARIITHNGAMALRINGALHPLTTYKSTEENDDAIFAQTVARMVPELARRGLHVHFVPAFFDWPAPGQYDFSRIDRRVGQVLECDPQAWVVIRIQAQSMTPAWWLKAHPEAVVRFGSTVDRQEARPPHQTPRTPSLASDFWLDTGPAALRALAQYVRRQPYASRVIGYLPTAYNTNEWFFRSYDETQVNDLCPAMQRAFAAHLQSAFGIERPAPVPDRIDRGQADRGCLFHPDPRQSRAAVVEYYRFLNQRCARAILQVTRTLREATAPSRLLIGTFYGYCLGLANFNWLPDSGSLALADLLQANDGPDFVCSPLEYFTRNHRDDPAGGFVWAQGTAPDSARLMGKAYFGEDDLPPPAHARTVGWSGADDEREDIATLTRNFAFSLCKGQLQWWYDLHGHYFESPSRLLFIERASQIARSALQVDRSPVSEVAVVVDEQASCYFTLDRSLQRAMCWESFYGSFGHIATPVDLLMLSDLTRTDMSRYCAIFFIACPALNSAQRAAVERLKSDGRTLVFFNLAGYIHPDGDRVLSAANAAALSLMPLVESRMLYQWRITTRSDHPLVRGVEDCVFGLHTEKTPSLQIDTDAGIEPMGHFAGRGPLALALRRHANWSSIYCGAPVMPAAIVRNILDYAGVHRYLTGNEVVYANRSYIAVVARQSGQRELRLVSPARVRECFTGDVLSDEPVRHIQWKADAYATHLFQLC